MIAAKLAEQFTAASLPADFGVGTWAWDIQGKTVHWSPQQCDMFGLSPNSHGESSVEGFSRFVHEEDRPRVIATVSDTLARKREGHEQRFRIVRPDGTVRHILSRARLELDSKGEPAILSGIDIDITRQESETAKANERLRLALASAGAGAWEWDMVAEKATWSPELYALFRLDPAKSAPNFHEFGDMIHPDDRDAAKTGFLAAAAKGGPFELRFRVNRGDGKMLWVVSVGRFDHDEQGRPVRAHGINQNITGRMQAEEDLRQSEQRFRAMFEQGAFGKTEIDPETGRILRANARFCAIVGRPEPEILGHTFLEFTHPDDQGLNWDGFLRMVRDEIPEYEVEKRFIRADGEIVWVHVIGKPIRDPEGRATAIFATLQDITARKQGEEKLRRSKDRLQAAEEAAGALVYDASDGVVWRSDGLTRMLGWQQDEVPSTVAGWQSLWHPDDLVKFKQATNATSVKQDNHYSIEYRVRHKNGHYVWVWDKGKVIRDAEGGIARMVGTTADITAAKEAEQRLRDEQRFTQSIIEAGPTLTYIYDIPGRRNVFVSPQCNEMLGYSAAEIAAMDSTLLTTLMHPDDMPGAMQRFEQILGAQADEIFELEYRMRRKNGEWVWLLSRDRVFKRDAAGMPVQILGIATDITERRHNEEGLRSSEEFNRTVLEASPDCLKVLDAQGHLQFMNTNGCTIMEIDDFAPLCGHDWRSFWPQPGQALVDDAIAKAKSGEASRFEAFCPTAKGNPRWWDVAVMPALDETGRTSRIIATSRDISERKQVEKALNDNRKRLKLGIAIAGFGLGSIDYLENTITLDGRAAEIFGLPADAPLPRSAVHQRFHPDDVNYLQARISALMGADGGEFMAVEHRIVKPDGAVSWLNTRKQIARDAEQRPVSGLLAVQDVSERKRHEEQQKLLLNELNHRVKNTLATVQGLASQTLRNTGNLKEARESFTARLLSLAKANDILTSENWESAPLIDVVERAVAPYRGDDGSRFTLEGPPLRVNPKFTLALSLALHELCTNAVKYGALSNDKGKVVIAWNFKGAKKELRLFIQWSEKGGPSVKPPTRRGFGSRLIERSLSSDLGGEVRIDFARKGVTCTIMAPLPLAGGGWKYQRISKSQHDVRRNPWQRRK